MRDYVVNLDISAARHGVTLYYKDEEANKDRFYHLDLSTGLWGDHIVNRQWGRRGTWGHLRLDRFDSSDAAFGAMEKIIGSKSKFKYFTQLCLGCPVKSNNLTFCN